MHSLRLRPAGQEMLEEQLNNSRKRFRALSVVSQFND
jgi:hypothetical protein